MKTDLYRYSYLIAVLHPPHRLLPSRNKFLSGRNCFVHSATGPGQLPSTSFKNLRPAQASHQLTTNTMKRTFLFLSVAASLVACNSSDNKTAEETKTTDTKVAAMSTNDLAYPVKDWGDWQPGSMENLKTALQSLKDFENGDIPASLKPFGDSVELRFDGMLGKFSKDSVEKMFTAQRKMSKQININMNDYETVKSKNGKEEWVSMWYTQKWEDQKGHSDSLVVMDDLKFENGKITVLDEKLRHFPKKKM